MAASSPAVSSQSTDTNPAPSAPATATAPVPAPAPAPASANTGSPLTPTTNSSKNLRGLNKPKCIKCGNVARSRCPFQSCKSCCAKAQNPCHIHVLKGSSNLPEKLPSSGSPKVEHQSTEVSHPGSSHRTVSLRQLSNTFAQFSNLQAPVRSRKPLTRKDAQVINEWRFLKLKEFRDSNIEAENEAFDRYMRNVNLLEEVFAVNSNSDGGIEDDSSAADMSRSGVEDGNEAIIGKLKLRLRSDPIRSENLRKRMQYVVEEGLRKLKKFELNDAGSEPKDPDELGSKPKKTKSLQSQRLASLNDLHDKLNKARNEEDLKACWEMRNLIFGEHNKLSHQEQEDSEIAEGQSPKKVTMASLYSPPKWFSTDAVDQETLCQIDLHFSSLEDIEEL